MKNGNKENDAETASKLLEHPGAADFEEAITATKFGKFNLLLILIAIPSGWSSIFETTTMSYVFPAAQCDLNLNLGDKGLLNAITYIGMISSAFIWGYLCDTLGRKKLLVIGLLLDGLFVIISSTSQSLTVLMISKFFGGFIINGPFAALTSYLSEFHASRYRARVQMVLGTIFSAGTICLPVLAGIILPANMNFMLFNNLQIHSWNILLFVTAIPPLLGGFAFIFLPESPKFLMSSGRNEQALKVFQMVYRINTGKPADSYPIKNLVDERTIVKDVPMNGQGQPVVDTKKSTKKALSEGWNQLKPLFIPPLLKNILLVCCLQALLMMSLNTLRLWLPQLFQAINDYEYYNVGESSDLCTMLDSIRPKNSSDVVTKCVVNTDNSQVYVNAIIVSTVTLFGYIIAGSLINFLGKKRLLCILGITGGLSGCALYLAQSKATILILSALYVGLGSIGINVVLSIVVDLFPTTLRTMTVSLTMMCGRIGASSGNLFFPFLIKAGCAPPFLTVGLVMFTCGFFVLLVPNTDMKALK